MNIYVRICLRVHVAWGHRGQTLLLTSSHSVRFLLRLPRRELLASVAKEPRRGPDDGRGAGAGASVSAFAARSIRWYDFQRRRGGLPVARPIVVVRPLCVRPAAPSSSSVLCPSAPSFVIRPLSVRPPPLHPVVRWSSPAPCPSVRIITLMTSRSIRGMVS